MKLSFIIPTYNEYGNITRLIKQINDLTTLYKIENEIIIIDDNSTDGTIQAVKVLQERQENLKLIIRKTLMGVGSAHREGYNSAQGDLIISMDADLSHSPKEIIKLINEIEKGHDLIIGSRFIRNGGTEQGLINRLISKTGGIYLSIILKIKNTDFTSGYRAITKNLWNNIKNHKFSNKNSFLIETIYYAYKYDAKIKEIPIFFKKREIGISKIHYIIEAAKALLVPLKVTLFSKKKKKG